MEANQQCEGLFCAIILWSAKENKVCIFAFEVDAYHLTTLMCPLHCCSHEPTLPSPQP